ncbi:MAG: SCO family protein [Pyrinomonadaceae bacterium]|nr:SCO family protein [Pyrinomonadaceae bacterium]
MMTKPNFFFTGTGHNSARALILLAALLCLSISFSCRQTGGEATSPNARRYDLQGKVVAVDKAEKRVSISHEEIKEYMDAMTMPFAVRKNDYWALDVLKPGDKVTAVLVVDGGLTWIENIVITEESAGNTDAGAQPGAGEREAQPGDTLPNFSLINQDGKKIRLAEYRGRALLLTFIYTRCPLPDYCPLMSENFKALEKELKKDEALYARTHLLSISFDTAYDTPKVLKSYGGAYTENYTSEKFTHWEFATGTPEEIRDIAAFFGLRYYNESGQIVHGLRTAIITPEGKVYKVYRGNEWKPEEALRDIQAVMNK